MHIRAAHDDTWEKYKPKIHYRPAEEFVDVEMYRKMRDVVRGKLLQVDSYAQCSLLA